MAGQRGRQGETVRLQAERIFTRTRIAMWSLGPPQRRNACAAQGLNIYSVPASSAEVPDGSIQSPNFGQQARRISVCCARPPKTDHPRSEGAEDVCCYPIY